MLKKKKYKNMLLFLKYELWYFPPKIIIWKKRGKIFYTFFLYHIQILYILLTIRERGEKYLNFLGFFIYSWV